MSTPWLSAAAGRPGTLLAGWWSPDGAPPPRRFQALAERHGLPTRPLGPFTVVGGTACGLSQEGGCVISGSMLGGSSTKDAADGAGAIFASTGDAARALGPLRGAFAAVLWRAEGSSAILARDHLGGRSLHAVATRRGAFFAEEICDLLPLLDSRPGPDARSVGLWLARGMIPLGRSLYEGVERLPPGGLFRLGPHSLQTERWWQLRFEGLEEGTPDELARRVVDGMDRAVARSASGERSLGVMLSGGLDSSAIASAAARAADHGARPVAYSGVFPQHPEVDESEKLDAVVEMLGIRSVRHTITGGSAVLGSLAYLRRWGLPPASPNHFLWEPLLAGAARDGITVMLDGEGGDEVFDVSGYLLADWLRQGRLTRAVSLTRRIAAANRPVAKRRVWRWFARNGLRGAAPYWAHRLARHRPTPPVGPSWLAGSAAADLAEDHDPARWKRRSGPLWWRHQSSTLTDTRELLDAHGYLRRRGWEAGLEGRHPFLHDVDLIEMALRVPPDPRWDEHLDRILLRRGLRGRLPDSVRITQDKRQFDPLFEAALQAGDAEILRSLLRAPDAETRAFTDHTRLESDVLAQDPERANFGAAAGHALWRLGAAECWLRAERDPRFLDSLDRAAG